MDKMKEYGKLLPGFCITLVIAAVAKWLEGLLPIHLIGASAVWFTDLSSPHWW